MQRFPVQPIPPWTDVRQGNPGQVKAQAELTALLRQAQAEQQRQAMAMLQTQAMRRIQPTGNLLPTPQWQDPGPVHPVAMPQPGDLIAALRQQFGIAPTRNPFAVTSRR